MDCNTNLNCFIIFLAGSSKFALYNFKFNLNKIYDLRFSMKYIKFFRELSIKDVPLVGGKNASLGEMARQLSLYTSLDIMYIN